MTLDQLAAALQEGRISLSEWEAQMRDVIRAELTVAMELAKGGRDNVTPSDWGYVGSQAKEQYDKLSAFARDIQSDPAKWLNGRLLNQRMDLYGQLGYSALEADLGREAQKGGFTEERNRLEQRDEGNCDGCLAETARGWVPIGELIPVGERDCYTNDRCEIEYRKPDGNGGWIYGDE